MRTRDENKEQAICEKAIEIIVGKGFDGLSMHKLAKAANVSPATIYIYFKDKEDLILNLCVREVEKMLEITFEGFDPDMSFSEGLWVQWKNRAKYFIEYPIQSRFLEQVRHTPYGDQANKKAKSEFSKTMGAFVKRAIENNQLVSLSSKELFWAIAFAPLYRLVHFHYYGGLHQEKFTLTEEMLKQSFALVLKALTPSEQEKKAK